MTTWSWADVPKLDARPAPPTRTPRRRGEGRGRPRHAVTLGHFDSTILSLVRKGEHVKNIAPKVGCSRAVISRRLRTLGVDLGP
jgi:hypothetical protein